jgi:putative spermidine/putrescine transport system ATP-binding protein
MSGGFLSLEGVRKEFDGVVAVDTFDLEVEPGEFVSFLGPSGCGKTTTLRMVAGFEEPTAGTIRLAGKDVTYAKPNERNIGMVFQSYALFPNMTVSENIAFGLRIRKEDTTARKERVDELLELIHLPDKGKAYPNELSGGQQQRVALARALAIRPQLLLLDEPLSALDAKIRDELRSEIRRIQRQLNITTVYVTHDQEEALALSDRIVVMSRGLMEQVGEPFEIYNNPATGFVASFVGQLNRLPVTVVDPAGGRLRAGHTEVRTTSLVEAARDTDISLMMRPEELTLDDSEENVLEGTVESVTFLGSIVRVQVAVDGGRLVADLFNERLMHLPQAGDHTQVSFPAHACWVMT